MTINGRSYPHMVETVTFNSCVMNWLQYANGHENSIGEAILPADQNRRELLMHLQAVELEELIRTRGLAGSKRSRTN